MLQVQTLCFAITSKDFESFPQVNIGQCSLCPFTATRKFAMDKHLQTHNPKYKYFCKMCFKRFQQLCHVRDHERTHTGDKPYECGICQRSFTQKSTLTNHMRTYHLN